MAKEKTEKGCDPVINTGCCRVEALVSVDEKGQTVLPKELREKAGIKAGDKLALSTWEKDGKVCCIFMVKADDLMGLVKDMLGPVMQEIAKK